MFKMGLKRKIIGVLIVVMIIVLFMSYHLVYNAYMFSVLNDNEGVVMFFGTKADGSYFIDLILWFTIILCFILIIIIIIGT